ncbi:hypothetical protein [Modestobacter sp. Leaf380]|uniref:hypothetical protein n=1 Tax=Modestobacter sp. Leaf380 TaxID=1736356 RepID=UPI0012FA8E24|nr:hypothetical protein [Modestobacter sp. Leaf380]
MDQQLAAISVGCAVELLSKALVADISPALLGDRGDRDSLLHLTDHGSLARKTPTEVKSIFAVEAVAAANHVHPSLNWRPVDSLTFRVRNASAHMALVEIDDLRKAVIELLRFVESAVVVRGTDAASFWGSSLVALAAGLLDEAATASQQAVARKQAAARIRLDLLLGPLDKAGRAVVLASLSGRKTVMAEHEEAAACPVCEQQGWLLCGVDRGPVQWDDGGNPYVEPLAWPYEFVCPVCGLELEGDELQAAGFPEEVELDLDLDPIEAFEYEPDEDWIRGR